MGIRSSFDCIKLPLDDRALKREVGGGQRLRQLRKYAAAAHGAARQWGQISDLPPAR